MKQTKRKSSKLPRTDSIEELAKFWDAHDLADFESELEEVSEPVFARRSAIKLDLEPNEAEVVARMAKAKGISQEELIRSWVREKLTRRKSA